MSAIGPASEDTAAQERDVSIQMTDAGKRYIKYEDQPMLATAFLSFRSRTRRGELWALRHISMEVRSGECVGVIGRNGAGKSTMLQLLAGVTAPTEGRVAVAGRIAPLIAVGVGFHPELTGRENVYLNGTILGLSRDEIEERFDDIVVFSEIAEFIDMPVKFYSSGMFVRLGFAVAIQADPQVLLVDEILAVGDLGFQTKCFHRMEAIRESGTTIVVVSHNLNAIRLMCDRTLLLHKGVVHFDGDTKTAISLYHELLREDLEPGDSQPADGEAVSVPGVAKIKSFKLLDATGQNTAHVSVGDPVTFCVEAIVESDVDNPVFSLWLTSESGVLVYSETSQLTQLGRVTAGRRMLCKINLAAELATGSYLAGGGIHNADLKANYSQAQPVSFFVSGRPLVGGVSDLNATFEIGNATDTST